MPAATSWRRSRRPAGDRSLRSDHVCGDQERARHHCRRHGLCRDAHGALADRARCARLFRDAMRPPGAHPDTGQNRGAASRRRAGCDGGGDGEVCRKTRAWRRDRAERPLWRRHASSRHLHVQADIRGRYAVRLRGGDRASLRCGRASAGFQCQRFDRDLPGGPAHPLHEALRRRRCPTRRCWRSSAPTYACRIW